MIQRIASKENLIIKRIKQLEFRKFRERYQQFVVEGSVQLMEAVISDVEICAVVYSDDYLKEPESQEIIEDLYSDGICVYCTDQRLFAYLSSTENPQGIMAVLKKPEWNVEHLFFNPKNSVLVLDRLQDPGNLGTILRTSEAAGYAGVIAVKGTTDPYSAKVVRAAAGALLRVPVLYTESAEDTIKLLHDRNKKILCTEPRAKNLYCDVDMSSNIAIIIGNEASGVSEEFIKGSDYQVAIPMEGKIESLNAGVAASILMYESKRQRYVKDRERKG